MARSGGSLATRALELWAATGWRGTGITAVAERAGITPAGLELHRAHGPADVDYVAVTQDFADRLIRDLLPPTDDNSPGR